MSQKHDAIIDGRFTIRSDVDGTEYEVTFEPSKPQVGSFRENGFKRTMNEDKVRQLLGKNGGPYLSQARYEGSVTFSGKIFQARYEEWANY